MIDTNQMELRLPDEKIKDLNVLLETYKAKKKIKKRKLLSLIGKLSFASKINPSGRTFLRRLINLSTTVDKLSNHISLNSEAEKISIGGYHSYPYGMGDKKFSILV